MIMPSSPGLSKRPHSLGISKKVAYEQFSTSFWKRQLRVTMKHYWKVDIGLSESANKFDLGWPWRWHFKVMKLKMSRIVLTVAPRPSVPKDKSVCHCPVNKSAPWPLVLKDFRVNFKVTNAKISSRPRKWKSHVASHRWKLDPSLPSDFYFNSITLTVTKIKLTPWVGYPRNSWASCLR